MVVKAGTTLETQFENLPSLASWFLAMKSDKEKMATFPNWPKLEKLCLHPGVDFAVPLAGGQS